jgi:putative FmdB family regulatory protein
MPTYEYACTACTHRFELVQKFTDAPITECPRCAGAVRKVYFAAGVVFKGSGWYINDSRPAPPSDSSSAPPATPDASPAPASSETATAPAATKSETTTAPSAPAPAAAAAPSA